MIKLLLGFILVFIFSCSSEEPPSVPIDNQNSGISNLLDSANKEISKLGESATEKDGLIDRITQELSSTNKSIDTLNNSLEALKLQYRELNNKNLNLSEEIKKLLDEKLLLEMSIKNLRTQYEAATIEKSVEGNKSKNIQKQEKPIKSEIPTPTPIPSELKNNDQANDFETAGLTIKIGGKNQSTPYLSSSV